MIANIVNQTENDAMKIKNNGKHTKQDSSDSSLSNSDSTGKSDYKIKICNKNNREWKHKYDTIKLCAK